MEEKTKCVTFKKNNSAEWNETVQVASIITGNGTCMDGQWEGKFVKLNETDWKGVSLCVYVENRKHHNKCIEHKI